MEGWTLEKVARMEWDPGIGGTHLIGRLYTRSCGCVGRTGIRQDRREFTFTAIPCGDHKGAVTLAIVRIRDAPLSDEPIEEMFARFLEEEILLPPDPERTPE